MDSRIPELVPSPWARGVLPKYHFYNRTLGEYTDADDRFYRLFDSISEPPFSFHLHMSTKGELLDLKCIAEEDPEEVANRWSRLRTFKHVTSEEIHNAIVSIRKQAGRRGVGANYDEETSDSTPTMEQVTNVAKVAKSANTRASAISKSVSSVKLEFQAATESVRKDVNQVQKDLGAVQLHVKNLMDKPVENAKSLEAVRKEVAEVRSLCLDLIPKPAENVTMVKADIDWLRAASDRTEEGMTSIKRDHTTLHEINEDLNTRMDSLSSEVALLRIISEQNAHLTENMQSKHDERSIWAEMMADKHTVKQQQATITKLTERNSALKKQLEDTTTLLMENAALIKKQQKNATRLTEENSSLKKQLEGMAKQCSNLNAIEKILEKTQRGWSEYQQEVTNLLAEVNPILGTIHTVDLRAFLPKYEGVIFKDGMAGKLSADAPGKALTGHDEKATADKTLDETMSLEVATEEAGMASPCGSEFSVLEL